MEKIRRGPGRPPKENKKVSPGGIVIYEETLRRVEERAMITEKSKSEIIQEALDLYFNRIDEVKKLIVTL